MLRAYFDDSGTHDDSPAVVVGGLIGSAPQWEIFELAWIERLRHPLPGKPSLKKFGVSDCRARWGEFLGYSNAEIDALTHDFRRIIIESDLIGLASAIDRTAWDELVVGAARDILGNALQACFIRCIAQAALVASAHPDNDGLVVVFDQGFKSNTFTEIANLYASHVGGNPPLVSITFDVVEQTPPLQGADMVATESFWHAQEWLKVGNNAQGRAHFQHYLKNMRSEGLILGRAEIEAEMKRREPGRSPILP